MVNLVFAASFVSHATVTEWSVVPTTCAFKIVGGVVSGPPPGGGGLVEPPDDEDPPEDGGGPAGVMKSPVALPSLPHTSRAVRTYE